MDLTRALEALYKEKAKLERVIAQLESLQAVRPAPRTSRGRKYMGAAERAAVSARMRAYWANRRAVRDSNQSPDEIC